MSARKRTQKWLYVFDKGPYSSMAGQEALDAALIGASFDQHVSLLFLYDGVFQLKQQQSTANTPIKQYTKTFSALADFDINNAYVHDLSMIARGLTVDDLMIDAALANNADVQKLIAAQDRVFTF